MVRPVGVRQVRFVSRVGFVASCLFWHFLLFVLAWWWLLLRGRGRAARKERFAQGVLDLFRVLGATFIKVGQILSTRPDLLPPHIVRALEKLQDDVGPFSYDRMRAILRAELGRDVEAIFAEFAATPIASASVAQVHKARLPDGRVVAVKVRRPGIEDICEFDLQMIRLVARLLSIPRSIRLLAPVESVDQFAHGIRTQLDFRIEAANSRRFRENFAGDPDVWFPALVEPLCTRAVLVMEYVEGVKILESGRTGGDGKRLARIGFQTLLKMVFAHGFVHADLHPGNIFVTPEGRVAILDVGLCAQLDDVNRGAFAAYFAAWARNDGRTMARIMVDYSPSRDKVPDYAGFERAVVEFAGRWWGKRVGEVQVGRVVFEMLNILRRYRVRANPVFTLVNIAIAVTEGIGKQLDPEIDMLTEAAPFFATIGLSTVAGSS
ncbi:MAG TPA: AarF/UbiB family protein [Polyangia bacterium]|nr:AarF/UbiB family protein [Polyangia bacterium]